MITYPNSEKYKSHKTKSNTDFSQFFSVNDTGRTWLSNQPMKSILTSQPFSLARVISLNLKKEEILSIFSFNLIQKCLISGAVGVALGAAASGAFTNSDMMWENMSSVSAIYNTERQTLSN